MNNTLDFNRLGKVIRRDGMNYIPNFGWSLVILWAIPLVIWLSTYSFVGQGGEIFGRTSTIKFLMLLALIIAPAKIYKDCNDSRKGIQYAMLPASTLEKFISMFFYCAIVTPLLYMIGAVAIDTILTIIPGRNPYNGFIFNSLLDTKRQSMELAGAMGVSTDALNNTWNEIDKVFSVSGLYLSKVMGAITIASIFMFGNMVFKKRKTSKMIGILIVISIFASIFFTKMIMNFAMTNRNIEFELAEEYLINIAKSAYYISLAVHFAVSAVMLGLTYHKIKTQKY